MTKLNLHFCIPHSLVVHKIPSSYSEHVGYPHSVNSDYVRTVNLLPVAGLKLPRERPSNIVVFCYICYYMFDCFCIKFINCNSQQSLTYNIIQTLQNQSQLGKYCPNKEMKLLKINLLNSSYMNIWIACSQFYQ